MVIYAMYTLETHPLIKERFFEWMVIRLGSPVYLYFRGNH